MLMELGSTSWALGIGVAAFTFFSGVASLILLVVNFLNGQHYNYVSILAVVIALDKFNSFAEQIYTLINFSQIMLQTFNMIVQFFRCQGKEPLPLFTTPDPVLSAFFSAQLFLVNSQGLLFFYWSLVLFASSWSLSPMWWKNHKVIMGTKISCLVLPALQFGLLRVQAIRDNDLANLVVMNVIILINIGMGSVFLVLTLIHVIPIQRKASGGTEIRLSRTYDGVVEFLPREIVGSNMEKGFKPKDRFRRPKIGPDGWLIARIALAFVMVEGLQVYMIVIQISFLQSLAHFKTQWRQGLSEPYIDESEEFANICSPIPGSLTGYLFFLVFGTTSESRAQIQKMYQWFKYHIPLKPNTSSHDHTPRGIPKTAVASHNISYPKLHSGTFLLSPSASPSPSQHSQSSFSPRRINAFPPISTVAPNAAQPRRKSFDGFDFGLENLAAGTDNFPPLSDKSPRHSWLTLERHGSRVSMEASIGRAVSEYRRFSAPGIMALVPEEIAAVERVHTFSYVRREER